LLLLLLTNFPSRALYYGASDGKCVQQIATLYEFPYTAAAAAPHLIFSRLLSNENFFMSILLVKGASLNLPT
jgi:hypothetical protein